MNNFPTTESRKVFIWTWKNFLWKIIPTKFQAFNILINFYHNFISFIFHFSANSLFNIGNCVQQQSQAKSTSTWKNWKATVFFSRIVENVYVRVDEEWKGTERVAKSKKIYTNIVDKSLEKGKLKLFVVRKKEIIVRVKREKSCWVWRLNSRKKNCVQNEEDTGSRRWMENFNSRCCAETPQTSHNFNFSVSLSSFYIFLSRRFPHFSRFIVTSASRGTKSYFSASNAFVLQYVHITDDIVNRRQSEKWKIISTFAEMKLKYATTRFYCSSHLYRLPVQSGSASEWWTRSKTLLSLWSLKRKSSKNVNSNVINENKSNQS